MTEILSKILKNKHDEVVKAKSVISLEKIKSLVENHQRQVKDFQNAIINKIDKGNPAIIAEIKRKSPSKGIICQNFNPQEIAKSYQDHGATCLSVLTDNYYFGGDLSHLKQVSTSTALPVLRKDFIIDEYQIYQSYYYQADAILLIVSALSNLQLKRFIEVAVSLSLSVLVEVHDQEEFQIALKLADKYPILIGVNNRDLKTFKVNINTTINLQNQNQYKYLISESGIKNSKDIKIIKSAKVYGFLIGEGFLINDNPGLAMKEMFEIN